jgi:hypothetical protein
MGGFDIGPIFLLKGILMVYAIQYLTASQKVQLLRYASSSALLNSR